jgi:indolepyruvate ferredoxin oxidoreductase
VRFLTGYQDEALARKYAALVERARKAEQKVNSTKLTEAVARYYAKLLAYKDEYEVARLHSDGELRKKIENMFEGDYRVVYHLAPPLLARTDPVTGEPKKIKFGPWMGGVFGLLKRFKFLRGTAFDVFGYTDERKTERALIREYEETVERLLSGLSAENHASAIQIASIPEEIRGYGHIKAKSIVAARKKRDELMSGLSRQQQKAA